MRNIFKNMNELELKENAIFVPVTLDVLDNVEIDDYIQHVLTHGRFTKRGIIEIPYDTIGIVTSYNNGILECDICYKNYNGKLRNFRRNLLSDSYTRKLQAFIAGMYIICSVDNEDNERNQAINDDIIKLKFDNVLDSRLQFPSGSVVIRYEYSYSDSELTIEKKDDYIVKDPRELFIRIGDAYIVDTEEGAMLFVGIKSGVAVAPLVYALCSDTIIGNKLCEDINTGELEVEIF